MVGLIGLHLRDDGSRRMIRRRQAVEVALQVGFDLALRVWDIATGECLRTLHGHTAWIGELWLSERSASGAQLSYHWQPEGGGKEAFVRKLFGAVDQNRWHDRKITAGGGADIRLIWFVFICIKM